MNYNKFSTIIEYYININYNNILWYYPNTFTKCTQRYNL